MRFGRFCHGSCAIHCGLRVVVEGRKGHFPAFRLIRNRPEVERLSKDGDAGAIAQAARTVLDRRVSEGQFGRSGVCGPLVAPYKVSCASLTNEISKRERLVRSSGNARSLTSAPSKSAYGAKYGNNFFATSRGIQYSSKATSAASVKRFSTLAA